MTIATLLRSAVETRLAPPAQSWLEQARREISAGPPEERFGALLSATSRHCQRIALAPTAEERTAARAAVDGLEIDRWPLLDAARGTLVLARPDLAQASAVTALETAFQFADEGELCALYRSLALLPEPLRFAWRAGEGCRTNMRSVFESIACDSPYPARCFDELAFNQCVVKAIFIGAPVGRIVGLAARRNAELTRMALDLADERRSAGRPVPADLWLALGPGDRERALASLALERNADATAATRARLHANGAR